MKIFAIIGMAATALFLLAILLILYLIAIHPAIQSISLLRWQQACLKVADPKAKLTLKDKWKIFKENYVFGGMDCERISNRYGVWYGVGDWYLNPLD